MATDLELQIRVLDELEFDPAVNSAHIGVTAHDGIVTLSGRVGSFFEKQAAEHAARRVKDVRAVAQNIEIQYASDPKLDDDEIASRVLNILEWHMAVPVHRLSVKVEHGIVTLRGEVDWYVEKMKAEEDVRRLGGVREVLNEIEVVVKLDADQIREQIKAALDRRAGVNAESITVVVDGGKVELHGQVHDADQRTMAEHIAWLARGVSRVDDHLRVTKHGHRQDATT